MNLMTAEDEIKRDEIHGKTAASFKSKYIFSGGVGI